MSGGDKVQANAEFWCYTTINIRFCVYNVLPTIVVMVEIVLGTKLVQKIELEFFVVNVRMVTVKHF